MGNLCSKCVRASRNSAASTTSEKSQHSLERVSLVHEEDKKEDKNEQTESADIEATNVNIIKSPEKGKSHQNDVVLEPSPDTSAVSTHGIEVLNQGNLQHTQEPGAALFY